MLFKNFGVYNRGVLAVILIYSVVTPTIVFTQAPQICKTCIRINETCYNNSHLWNFDVPFRNEIVIKQLGVLRDDNTLYYSFEPEINNAEYYKVGFRNLNRPAEQGVINSPNINFNFGTFDMDQNRKMIYLGGSDGVYQLDYNTKNVTHFSSHGDTIISVFFKTNVYFVRDREHEIIKKNGNSFYAVLRGDEEERIKILPKITVKNFVITKNDVVVFLSNQGLFVCQLAKDAELVRISKNDFFRGLTIDLEGTVYAWWIDGIYKVIIEPDIKNSEVVKVAHLPNIGAMTFDNMNDILYTSEKGLFKLTKSAIHSC